MTSKKETKPIVIAVMGATGTGKSTFVNLASGGKLTVGDGLRSCTSEVAYSKQFLLDGRRVVLIDTPGFDDTTVSDTDILKRIALELQMTYEQGFKLSGILYLYRISDVRMGGISRRNLNMFRKLCGDDTLKNVLLVTTMWGLVDPVKGTAREEQLATDELLFKPILDGGARMVRHDNTLGGAHDVIRMVLRNHPLPLLIQKELVDEGKDISETGAGEALGQELAELARKHRDEIKQVQQEMAEAMAEKDEQTRKELDAYQKQLQQSMEKAEQDRDRLSSEYKAEKKRADEEMQKIRQQLQEERKLREERQRQLDLLQDELKRNANLSSEMQAEMRGEIQRLQARLEDGNSGGFFGLMGRAFNALFRGRF
ncbi:hypothetical protein K474DRAFT_1704220 [Panus rudis PR-1116 ss-1]|nr:hypothetical protein K474DRAFT_1704220 [Panus rudis PR-1116 ss-1]